MGMSLAERFAALPLPERRAWVLAQDEQTLEEMARGEWWWLARPEQVPPDGEWLIFLALAGRGFGKTRAGSEWLVDRILDHPVDKYGVPTEWVVVAETLSDVRTICIEGPAGLLRVLDRRGIPYHFTRSPKPVIYVGDPKGPRSKVYFEGADSPDVGRGYNAAGYWLDEIAKWKDPSAAWTEGIMPSLRADLVNDHPRAFVTTTPKPIPLLREWVARTDGSIHIVRGSTYDNASNLSSHIVQELRNRYEGTKIGLQELYGELLDLSDGAMFKMTDIEIGRVDLEPDLIEVIVGIDPSLTGDDDLMGIVVVGRDMRNEWYVLADESVAASGREAAAHCWRVFQAYSADKMIYETNLGKRWMHDVFRDAYDELRANGDISDYGEKPPMQGVDAKVGKELRAQPVAMRYEQHRVHHVGQFIDLEEEMVTWDPKSERTKNSPDRLDALVHACRALMASERRRARIVSPTQTPLPRASQPFL